MVTPYFSRLLNSENTIALNAGFINNQNPFVTIKDCILKLLLGGVWR